MKTKINSEEELITKLFKLVGKKIKPSRITFGKINTKREVVNISDLEWVKKGARINAEESKNTIQILEIF